jgi:hypothetical protein
MLDEHSEKISGRESEMGSTKRTWHDFRLESVMRAKADAADRSEFMMGSRPGS